MNRNNLVEQRSQLLDEMEQMLLHAEGENRGLNEEEIVRRDQIMARATAISDQLATIDRIDEMRASNQVSISRPAIGAVPVDRNVIVPTELHASNEYREAFRQFLQHADDRELRAIGATTTTSGGYLVPTITWGEIWNLVQTLAPVVSKVKKLPSTDWAVKVPTVTANGGFAYTTEGSGTNANDPTTGALALNTLTAQWLIGVDNNLESSTVDVDAWLRGLFAEGLAEFLEAQICKGVGTTALEGLTVGGKSAKTTASTTAITRAEIDAVYWAMPEKYLNSAEWAMAGSTAAIIDAMANAVTGDSVWGPSLADGVKWQLKGSPANLSSGMAAWAAGAKPLAFFNPMSYVLKDGGLTIEISDHFIFDKRQRAYRAVWTGDGKLVKDTHCQYLTVKS